MSDGAGDQMEHKKVSAFELFFDLVFVYAFTQVTALMAADPTWQGLARGALAFAALWWAWGAYVWLATSTDLDEGFARIGTIAVMCAMLVVGVTTPGAFDEAALPFALAYTSVRVMHIVVYAYTSREDPVLRSSVLRLVPGVVITGVAFIGATWTEGWTTMAIWTVAMLIEYMAPYLIEPGNWTVNAEHFAERFGLIFIIALGESLIALGVGVGDHPMTWELSGLVTLGVVIVATLWWTYFDVVAIVAERRLTKARGRERNMLARDSYTYLHLPMILGVILFALGAKKTMTYPHEPLEPEIAFALVGGVVLYLIAHVCFRLRNIRTLNRPRTVTSVLLVVIGLAVGTRVDAGTLLTVIAVVLCALVTYEVNRYRETRARIRSRPWEQGGAVPLVDAGEDAPGSSTS